MLVLPWAISRPELSQLAYHSIPDYSLNRPTVEPCYSEPMKCGHPSIQRPSIILTLLLIMLTFLNLKKCGLIVLTNSPAQVHITTPTGSISEARYLHYRHTAVVPTESTLEGLHCIRFRFVGLHQSFESSRTGLGLQLVRNRHLSYLTATASTVLALLPKPLILSCSAIS